MTRKKKNTIQYGAEEGKLRVPAEGELFAVVLRILGGNRLEVQCEDGKKRTARIPGRLRRRVWVRVGDLVLVEIWADTTKDDNCELVHRYRHTEINQLKRKGYLKNIEQFLST